MSTTVPLPNVPQPSEGLKAINYAEVKLNVHNVYSSAIMARNDLDDCLNRLSEKRDVKRSLENSIVDREMELSANERSNNPEMSDAALGRHLKIVYHEDVFLKETRKSISSVLSDIDGLECDRSVLDTDIKIETARLYELGGYLQYLAAVKLASKVT